MAPYRPSQPVFLVLMLVWSSPTLMQMSDAFVSSPNALEILRSPSSTLTPLGFRISTTLLVDRATPTEQEPSSSNDRTHNNDDDVQSRPTSSRSKRKALERQRKQRKTSASFQQRSPGTKTNTDITYMLHSLAISKLTPQSSPDDVLKAIKRAQKMHDHHDIRAITDFLIKCGEGFGYGYRGSLLSRAAVAALHFEDHRAARSAIEVRRRDHRNTTMPMESAAIIRGLLRVHNVTDALQILDDELSLHLEGSKLDSSDNKERLKHRALSLASIASRHFFEGEPSMAMTACQRLADLGPVVRESGLQAVDLKMPWLRIINGAAQCESGRRDGSVQPCIGHENVALPCNLVYSVLNAMTTFPSDNNDRVFEALSNALVRRVLFVTGAIDMAGCPPADRGEAVFIGRSNVGKSSLVNMVTNRKSLAFTSKRPGKTQQFNFFAVNDKPDRGKEIKYGDKIDGEKDRDSFNIVDLPGFGFARVPEKQRQQWSEFMHQYLGQRKSLRVVFHLIDARHGPIDEDTTIMKRVSESLPKNVAYVVVLTKADKNVKGAAKTIAGTVSRDVMTSLRTTMRANNVGDAPVILTSAETKYGRDDMWRYLRLAAEA